MDVPHQKKGLDRNGSTEEYINSHPPERRSESYSGARASRDVMISSTSCLTLLEAIEPLLMPDTRRSR